jgi:Na+-transporting NADH:ubiquinone oxidoreductase subunit NqrA
LIKKDSILGNIVRVDKLKAQTTNTTRNDVNYVEYVIELTAIYERGRQKELLGFVKRDKDKEAVLKTYYSDPAEYSPQFIIVVY